MDNTTNQQTRIGNSKESLTQIVRFKSYTFELIVLEVKTHAERLRHRSCERPLNANFHRLYMCLMLCAPLDWQYA